jgi:hypothetical protein|nr:MAG TPA: hypothetical protein [Caudoviricetes sp.]
MDAVKFVEERRRMFAVTGEAPKYTLFNKGSSAEDVVKEVEGWSAANPRKTRQSVFLEQWPEAFLYDEYGILQFCPRYISAAYRNDDGRCKNPEKKCIDCRREFWMQEVE